MLFKTKEFILRELKKEDIDLLWKCYDDKGIAKNMVMPMKESEFKRELIDSLKKKQKDRDQFIIEIHGKAAGLIKIHDIIPKLKGRTTSWLGKHYRGKGIMTSAKKIALSYWFEKYKLKRIYAYVRAFNIASIRSLEKSGYKREGILRKNILKEGKYYDDYVYAVVK